MSPTMPTTDTLQSRLNDLLSPLYLLLISLSYFPSILLAHPFLFILNFKAFQTLWFGSLWKTLGPQMSISPEQIPYISSLFNRAHGNILEFGPGGGDQIRHLKKAVSEGRVELYVGAEPTVVLHERLRANAKGVGLDDAKIRVLNCGAQPESLLPALHKADLLYSSSGKAEEGCFDTILAVKSMCSAPQAEMDEIAEMACRLLKPGGEFLFFEHVKNNTDLLTMVWAWALGWIWPTCMGGCHLDGRIDFAVKRVKGWNVDVRNTREFMGWNIFRYVVGVCKKGNQSVKLEF